MSRASYCNVSEFLLTCVRLGLLVGHRTKLPWRKKSLHRIGCYIQVCFCCVCYFIYTLVHIVQFHIIKSLNYQVLNAYIYIYICLYFWRFWIYNFLEKTRNKNFETLRNKVISFQYQESCWSNDFPHPCPEKHPYPWLFADHILDVSEEAICTIHPRNENAFSNCYQQNWPVSSVLIH